MEWKGGVGFGKVSLGPVRLGGVRQGMVECGRVWSGEAWFHFNAQVGLGSVGHGSAILCWVRYGMIERPMIAQFGPMHLHRRMIRHNHNRGIKGKLGGLKYQVLGH